MNKIRLTDGSEYAVVFAGKDSGVLAFQTVEQYTVPEIANVFSNRELTMEIQYFLPDGTMLEKYQGYTRLIGVLLDRYEGNALVQLEKG